jgi:hypothetical protein
METNPVKCVMIVADDLPPGLAVNTAAVLAITLGRKIEHIVGPDIPDRAGLIHTGLTWLPIPILTADSETLRGVRAQAAEQGDLLLVDVTDAAQEARTYETYERRLAETPPEDLVYRGVAIYGPKKRINGLTGRLPLFGSPREPQVEAVPTQYPLDRVS